MSITNGGVALVSASVLVRADDSFERMHRETLARLPGVLRLVSQFAIRTVVDAA